MVFLNTTGDFYDIYGKIEYRIYSASIYILYAFWTWKSMSQFLVPCIFLKTVCKYISYPNGDLTGLYQLKFPKLGTVL